MILINPPHGNYYWAQRNCCFTTLLNSNKLIFCHTFCWLLFVWQEYICINLWEIQSIHRDCCPKFATGLKCLNSHRSKSIWVTSLFFCQNDSIMGNHFGKRTAWSLLYSYNYAYSDIWSSRKFWATVYTLMAFFGFKSKWVTIFETDIK